MSLNINQAIDSYIADYAASLHPDIPPDGKEVMARLTRDELMNFSYHVGNVDASTLGPEQIASFVAVLNAEGAYPLYDKIRLGHVREFCSWLIRKGILSRNPVPARLCGSWWERSSIRAVIRALFS